MSQTQTQNNRSTGFQTMEPKMYNVIMHNDDETTMEFVVHILTTIFRKSFSEAEALMLKVHHEGAAVAGKYIRDIAESKANKATREARANGYPLQLTIEEA